LDPGSQKAGDLTSLAGPPRARLVARSVDFASQNSDKSDRGFSLRENGSAFQGLRPRVSSFGQFWSDFDQIWSKTVKNRSKVPVTGQVFREGHIFTCSPGVKIAPKKERFLTPELHVKI